MTNDPLIGKKLANYRIERLLGRGGMASVYYATDLNLKRPVAVKLIDIRYQGNPAYAKRFVDEARMVARWRHENIIQVFYADNQDDLYYFTMEYIEGVSLEHLMSEYVSAGELMPHEDVIRIGKSVASALDYAHTKGVIHRDVKPSNIMISFDDRVVLADFGLALNVERGTVGEVFGTPHYIAPEQAQSSASAVPQSDVYALGVIMYEILTGSVPFDDPSAASLALQHLATPPPKPRSINPLLSPAIETVLLKALEKSPDERYQSGAELMSALANAVKFAKSQAQNPEDDGLPLPPVAVANRGQLQLSIMSVSEKIALNLDNAPTPPTLTASKAEKAKNKPKVVPPVQRTTQMRAVKPKRSSSSMLIMGVVGLLLIVVVGVGLVLSGQFDSGDDNTIDNELILPTSVAQNEIIASTEELTDSLPTATEIIASDIPASTITEIIPTQTNTLVPSVEAVVPSTTPIQPPATLIPTFTAILVLPTATLVPATPIPQPTILYPTGRRIELYYDEYSFYMWNGGADSFRVSQIVFEAMDANGVLLTNRFDGVGWSAFYNAIESGRCDALEIGRAPAYLRPTQCGNYNSVVNPPPDDPEVFWIGSGITMFRVVWNGQEIGRCEAGTGACVVFAPE